MADALLSSCLLLTVTLLSSRSPLVTEKIKSAQGCDRNLILDAIRKFRIKLQFVICQLGLMTTKVFS